MSAHFAWQEKLSSAGSEISPQSCPIPVVSATDKLPWAEIKGMRIVVDHAYHSIDYERVWRTLRDDVPALKDRIDRWVEQERRLGLHRFWDKGRSHGPDVGLGL